MGKGKSLKNAVKYGVAVAKKNSPGFHKGHGKTGPALTKVSYERKGVGVRQKKSSTGGTLGKNARITNTDVSIGRKPKGERGRAFFNDGPVHVSDKRVKKTRVKGVYKTQQTVNSFDSLSSGSSGSLTFTYHGTVIHPAYPAGVGGVAAGGIAAEGYRRSQSKHPGTRNKRNG